MKHWYVVYTKPKWEKKVAEQLSKAGVECYCPLVIKIQQWSDRKKKVAVPLFNSYVFVHLEEADRNVVFQSAGAVRYLFWLGKPAVVRAQEIQTIQAWLQQPQAAELTVTPYQKGDVITVQSGPFAAQEAIIQEVNKTHCVLVLESLGCVLKMRLS